MKTGRHASLRTAVGRIAGGVVSVAAPSMERLPKKQKRMKRIGAAAIALALLTPLGADAQEAEVTANAGWVSQYFYRGILQKTSSASAGLDVGFGALSLGTWLADVGDGAEVDLYGSVGTDVEGVSLSAGGTAYLYTGEFDDTYLEANLGAGYGPLSVEFSIGQYENFGAETLDYWFFGLTGEHEGFFGTFGTFGSDFDGAYLEAGYGFSAAELDFTISGILNDKDLSGLADRDGDPTSGQGSPLCSVSARHSQSGNEPPHVRKPHSRSAWLGRVERAASVVVCHRARLIRYVGWAHG